MANRFSRWAPTNYVALPTDMYQTAVASKEQQGLIDLEKSKVYQDQLEGIEAISEPAKALKNKHLSELQNQIQQLSKRNFTTQEALMELKKVIYDKNRINDLYNISLETANYKKLNKEAETYTQEYGNDFNIDEFQSKWEAYNQSNDPTTFNPKLLQGAKINSYIPIVEEMRNAIGKYEKESGDEIVGQSPDGTWFTKSGRKGITSSELFKDAQAVLTDPTYQTQLQTLSNYYARRNGSGDQNKGFELLGKQHIKNNILFMESQLSAAENQLQEDIKNKEVLKLSDAIIENRKKEIKDKKAEIDEVKSKLEKNQYTQDDYRGFSKQALMNTLISSAIAPLDHMVGTRDIPTLNPLKKAELDYNRDIQKMQIQQRLDIQKNYKNKFNDLTLENQFSQPVGLPQSIDGNISIENEAKVKLEKDFPNLELDADGLDISVKNPKNTGIIGSIFKPEAWLPGYEEENKDAEESYKRLQDFAKTNDPEGYKAVIGDKFDGNNKQHRQYLANVYKKHQAMTKSIFQSLREFPITESQGFDTEKTRGLISSIITTVPTTIYEDGIKSEKKITDIIGDKKITDDKGGVTYESIMKNANFTIRSDGHFLVKVTGTNAKPYTIVMEPTNEMKSYFKHTNNVINPTNGFGMGTVAGAPLVTKRMISFDKSIPSIDNYIFQPKVKGNIYVSYDPDNEYFENTDIGKVFSKSNPELETVLKNMPKEDIINYDISSNRQIPLSSRVDSGNIITFAKDKNGVVYSVDASPYGNKELQTLIVTEFREKYGLKAKKTK
jgi:hypothetical protein